MSSAALQVSSPAFDPAPAPLEGATEAGAGPEGDDWVALGEEPLSLDAACRWVVRPECGGVGVFFGTVRDHAEGRSGVGQLVYEAYDGPAAAALATVVAGARLRWPDISRTVVWHRTGALAVTEVAVVVAVSTPHRAEACDAARWIIDTVKASVPIWKQETWSDGQDWATGARPIVPVAPAGPATEAVETSR